MPDRTVAQKLLIKPGQRLWLSPATDSCLVEPLPENVSMAGGIASADVAIVSVSTAAGATNTFAANADDLGKPPVLWVFYPKGNVTDINRDSLWPLLAVHGLRPITQVAVDETWSALRFRPLKPGEAQFTGGKG